MLKDKTKKTREEKKKMATRVLAMILAILMVLGMAYYTISILVSAVSAAEDAQTENTVLTTSSLKDSGDVLISVGLMYGSNITTGFQTVSTDGYTVGMQQLAGKRDFQTIWDLNDTVISSTADDNLSKNGMTFLIANGAYDTTIGGYHVQIDCDMYDRQDVEEMIWETESRLAAIGLYAIPSYIYTGYALRIGAFSTWDEANSYLGEVEAIFGDQIYSIVGPSRSAVSVLNPNTDRILFEFDCGGEDWELGLEAHEDSNGNTYIQTPAGNLYDGIFCFHRYNNGTTDGVALTNILPLEAYVAGVLPYETSNAWPLEMEKAFAITVRSFTLTHLNKHSDYGFDLCNSTDCQVYKGAGKINDLIMDAVKGTAGLVMTYDGSIVTAYYSSSVGGVTVSAQDAWGGKDVPYLRAVETPWENYMVHSNAFWISEISPDDLLDRLHLAGFDELRGSIADVEIVELAKNSTYVKGLMVTDIYGNSVTIRNTDTVRRSLTPYVKSANFVVGQGRVEYTENVIVDYVEEEDLADTIYIGGSANQYDKDYAYVPTSELTLMTAEGLREVEEDEPFMIMTAEGLVEYDKKNIFVLTPENAGAYLGDDYTYEAEKGEDVENKFNSEILEDKSTNEVLYKVAHAADDDNFIFVGKGWGHGVGMSQYGARDLALKGHTAEQIIAAYFSNVSIVDYWDSANFK